MRHLLILYVSILFCFSCKEKAPALLFDIPNLSEDYLVVSNIVDGILDTIHRDAETIAYSLDLKTPAIITVNQGYRARYVYIEPNKKSTIRIHSDTTNLVIESETKLENKYIQLYDTLLQETNITFPLLELGNSEPEVFLTKLSDKYVELRNLVNKMREDDALDTQFSNTFANRLEANYCGDLLSYRHAYKYHYKKEPNLNDNFYGDLSKVSLDKSLLLFDDSRRFVSSYLEQGVDYKKFESVADYYAFLFDKSSKEFEDSDLSRYCQYENLTNQINFGSGIDGASDILIEFKNQNINNYYEQNIIATTKPWMNLKKGMVAPDFNAMTRKGKNVKLSSLKGKTVYVDVWATWCGPCIAEIPALKTLEYEMNKKDVEFVSISIDDIEDKEKWSKFIIEKELGGVQLMAENGWQSEISKQYNIKGIPRFMLINKEGNIVSANTSRPSAPTTKEKILATL